nr:hypothetical protein Q903MT_gene518 [Picea sitchensis]
MTSRQGRGYYNFYYHRRNDNQCYQRGDTLVRESMRRCREFKADNLIKARLEERRREGGR